MAVELGSGQYLMIGAAVIGLGALAVVVAATLRRRRT
jgi:MYXO-CTERM domain-containing protein